MHLYGLKNCDTCRKALRSVPALQLVDVRTEGVPPAILSRALAQFGKAVINTRSTTWRGLSEADKSQPPETLLAAHPTVMKRPLIVVDNQIFLGWSNDIEAEVKAVL